jgi:hypothetical protein
VDLALIPQSNLVPNQVLKRWHSEQTRGSGSYKSATVIAPESLTLSSFQTPPMLGIWKNDRYDEDEAELAWHGCSGEDGCWCDSHHEYYSGALSNAYSHDEELLAACELEFTSIHRDTYDEEIGGANVDRAGYSSSTIRTDCSMKTPSLPLSNDNETLSLTQYRHPEAGDNDDGHDGDSNGIVWHDDKEFEWGPDGIPVKVRHPTEDPSDDLVSISFEDHSYNDNRHSNMAHNSPTGQGGGKIAWKSNSSPYTIDRNEVTAAINDVLKDFGSLSPRHSPVPELRKLPSMQKQAMSPDTGRGMVSSSPRPISRNSLRL